MTESDGTIEVDGIAIAWRRVGSGEPLLALNGYAATKADWDPSFVEALAGFCDLICPDNRGIGESGADGSESELTIERMAADALTVIDGLGIERTAVLGWSMGGYVAQALAALAPDRVSALVLLATDPGGSEAVRAEASTWARLTDRSGTPREQASRLIGLLFPPEVAPAIDREFGEVVAEARAALDPPVLEAQERAMERWHREPGDERLAGTAVPALCAAGLEDVVIPPANAELLAARLPRSWHASFPGGGHAFMAQEPRRLATLIRAFLDI